MPSCKRWPQSKLCCLALDLRGWIGQIQILIFMYPYTHDLMSLMQRLEGLGHQVLTEFEPLLEFTLFAVQFRYGFMDTLDEPPDREGAIALVSSLHAVAVSQVRLAGE